MPQLTHLFYNEKVLAKLQEQSCLPSFKKNRDAVKKYLLIFFLGIVSLSMVVVMAPLPSGDTSRPEGNVLASIGGNTITSADLDQTIRDRFKNSPMGFDRRMVPMVAPSVLDQMVIEQILVQQAAKMGVEVSDQEVLKTFQSIPWLYPDGNFVGADRAADMVAQNTGKTLAQFEGMLRDSLLEEKIRSIVTDGVQVTPAEVLAEFRHRNTKAKIDYVLFDPSQFLKDVKVTPEALEAFFKKDPAHYKLPEQRQVRYVVIDPDQVRAQVKVDEAELREYYAQHLSDYRVPDRVKVAHILFKTTGKTPAEVATIREDGGRCAEPDPRRRQLRRPRQEIFRRQHGPGGRRTRLAGSRADRAGVRLHGFFFEARRSERPGQNRVRHPYHQG